MDGAAAVVAGAGDEADAMVAPGVVLAADGSKFGDGVGEGVGAGAAPLRSHGLGGEDICDGWTTGANAVLELSRPHQQPPREM